MKGISSQAHILLILFSSSIISNFPIIFNPSIILDRGNDLEEFFWPIIHFTKNEFIKNGSLPFWNSLFFSGTPLLPDPQSLIFYPLNIIFLLMPINIAFIFSVIIHSLIGSIGFYLLSNKGFGLSKRASILSSILYILSPKLFGYMEAGHFGLILSFAWIPFAFLSTVMLSKKPRILWSLVLAVSLAAVFNTHTITFLQVCLLSSMLFLALTFSTKNFLAKIAHYLLGIFLCTGLTAINLLPQIEWVSSTTRFLLLENRDVYPKWNSTFEFLSSAINPLLFAKIDVSTIDSEKLIALGITPLIVAIIGFLALNRKLQLLILLTSFSIALISLNNFSPIDNLLLSQDYYVLSRVSTRIWFAAIIIVATLSGVGLQRIIKKRGYFGIIVAFVATGELLLTSWTIIQRPIKINTNLAPIEVYEFLANDKSEKFRVFCTTRCLSQKLVAEYELETIEGYGTLQQNNYFNQFTQLSQVFWDRYTLALPPFEIYKFQEIQPYAPELADYNVKYVISPHIINDTRFVKVKEIDQYYIYQNNINKSRAYFSDGKSAELLKYSPNSIIVSTENHLTGEFTLSEVWNPGWNAYLNGEEKVDITEQKNALRLVKIKPDTKSVVFRYEPESYIVGKMITITTIITIILIILLQRRKLFQEA